MKNNKSITTKSLEMKKELEDILNTEYFDYIDHLQVMYQCRYGWAKQIFDKEEVEKFIKDIDNGFEILKYRIGNTYNYNEIYAKRMKGEE